MQLKNRFSEGYRQVLTIGNFKTPARNVWTQASLAAIVMRFDTDTQIHLDIRGIDYGS
jgi:hypothetical protein